MASLLDFCSTVNQRSIVAAYLDQGGSVAKAAKALGVSRDTIDCAVRRVKEHAARRGWAPEHGLIHALPDGLTLRGTSIDYGPDGEVRHYWNKSKPEGMDPEKRTVIPDPKLVTKTATLYDSDGRVTQQWVSEKKDEIQREKLWRDLASEIASSLPRFEPVPPPKLAAPHLLACYPVGDHHLGMLSWEKETGSNYDLDIGEQLLANASAWLIDTAPPSEQALIAFLGDFVHYDSMQAITPTSGNLLDADSRYPKMIRAAIRSMRAMIDRALHRHKKVNVIVEIGNHDLVSSIFLMECLSNAYEHEERITIDTSPSHYHYFRWGKVLIGTHHGHGSKAEALPLIMAADRAADWGETLHRYWWTGHVHHDRARDIGAVRVESFRVLPPADAWAHQKGYRPIREMKSIVMHNEHGEVARATVSPTMFKEAA